MIALSTQLPIQRGTVVISLLSSFENLTFISINQTGSSSTMFRLGIAVVREPLSNGSFPHSNLHGNVACTQTLEMKGEDLFIPLLSLCFSG